MTPDRASLLRDIFDQAVELPHEQRPGYLDEACGGDAELRAEVEALLREHDADPDFLDLPIGEDADRAERDRRAGEDPGVKFPEIDRYRVLRVIGSGGMGVVYEAQQDHPKRRVAIKVIHQTRLVDQRMIRLFKREADSLARLRHLGIAAIYEAGRTKQGQPFFAMELVDGAPLHDYVRQRGLDTRQKLELFQKITHAVSHAHQHGVIHRDLKPANILVTPDGNPKILDFGLAKMTEADVSAVTTVTEVGKIQGTLPYMSPEQARGEPGEIDFRSDVYSLGVVLYELLTERLPYDLGTSVLHEAVRVICEEPPRRPSTVVRKLSGDVETIALTALDKDPARRYQSVAALAQDVDRYLTDLPILARPPTAVYQFRKLIARHKGPFGFTAALFIVIMAFGIWMAVLYGRADRLRLAAERERAVAVTARDAEAEARTRAEQEAEKAGQVQAFLQNMLASVDPQFARGRDTTILRQILSEAGRKVESELADQPEVQSAARSTIGMTYSSLGMYEEAESHLRASLKIQRRLFEPDDLRVVRGINNLANVLVELGRYDRAEALLNEASAVLNPASNGARWQLASTTSHLAAVHYYKGDYDKAEPLYREALRIWRELLGDDDPEVATALNKLALLLQDTDRLNEAESMHREALEIRRRVLGDDHPHVAVSLSNLASVLNDKRDFDAAESLYRESLTLRRRLYGDEHPAVATALHNLAWLLYRKGEYDAAEPLYREALALRRRIYGEEHPRVANTLGNLAQLMDRAGNEEAAEPLYREALALRRKVLGSDHPDVALNLNALAILLRERGDFAAAEPLFREALAIRKSSLGVRHPSTLAVIHSLADLLTSTGDYVEAEALFREAFEGFREIRGDDHFRTLSSRTRLAQVLLKLDRASEAEPLLEECLEIVIRVFPEGHWAVGDTESILGACLTAQARYEQAEPLVLRGYAGLKKGRGETDELTIDGLQRIVDLYTAWGKSEEADRYRRMLPDKAPPSGDSTTTPAGESTPPAQNGDVKTAEDVLQ